jgi:exoribonuclease-2
MTERNDREQWAISQRIVHQNDSRDLDQLTFANAILGGGTKILVPIADVDALVKKQPALDDHAPHNTTSVYTAAKIFRSRGPDWY